MSSGLGFDISLGGNMVLTSEFFVFVVHIKR